MKKTLYPVLTALFITLIFTPITLAQDSPQWHLPEGAKMRLGKGRANEIAYSPDGTKLAVASAIGIWIYDAQTGEELDLFPANRFGVSAIAFSPDGKMLISNSRDRTLRYFARENLTIRLWDVNSGRQIRTFTGHTHPITCLAFSPDGKTIASGSTDYVVRVWDVESGRQLHRLIGPTTSVTSRGDMNYVSGFAPLYPTYKIKTRYHAPYCANSNRRCTFLCSKSVYSRFEVGI